MTENLAQIVIGPPGSGKSTYCLNMANFMKKIGRKVVIVNLDPGNDQLPYEAALCVTELIRVEEVMEHLSLGPNGALMYAMDYLASNFDWLWNFLKQVGSKHFIIFDFPGQVELYTHSESVKNLLEQLEKKRLRICAVNLIDSHHCVEPGKFVAGLLTSLTSMLHISMPQINVLSKIDLLEKYEEKLAFNLDYYTDVLDLSYLTELLDSEQFTSRYKKLNEGIASIIENFGLVGFIPLNILNRESLRKVLAGADKALGYTPSNTEEELIHEYLNANPDDEVDEHLNV